MKPRVGFGPANRHAGSGERIVEFSGPGGGGLISVRTAMNEDGDPYTIVDVYRTDESVMVYGPTRATR